jgi:hypothetical protein
MSTEQNKAALERARQNWNAGHLEAYLQIYSPDRDYDSALRW